MSSSKKSQRLYQQISTINIEGSRTYSSGFPRKDQVKYERMYKKKVQYSSGKMIVQSQLSGQKQRSCTNLMAITQTDKINPLYNTYSSFRPTVAKETLKEKIMSRLEQEKYYGLNRVKFQNYKYQMPSQGC